MSARTPIEPSEIRKGDLIRWEGREQPGDALGRLLAVEYRASRDEHDQFHDGEHFLLDRPAPAVELPTEPTLGWLSFGETAIGPFFYHRAVGHGGIDRPFRNGKELAGQASAVTSFTEAEAVPAEALDALREAHVDSGLRYCGAVQEFLAAVDRANGSAS